MSSGPAPSFQRQEQEKEKLSDLTKWPVEESVEKLYKVWAGVHAARPLTVWSAWEVRSGLIGVWKGIAWVWLFIYDIEVYFAVSGSSATGIGPLVAHKMPLWQIRKRHPLYTHDILLGKTGNSPFPTLSGHNLSTVQGWKVECRLDCGSHLPLCWMLFCRTTCPSIWGSPLQRELHPHCGWEDGRVLE